MSSSSLVFMSPKRCDRVQLEQITDCRGFVDACGPNRLTSKLLLEFVWQPKLVRVDEIAQRHAQCNRKRRSVVDRNVDRRALDATYISSRHPSLMRERLLCHVSQSPGAAQISGKRLSGR